MFDNVIVGVNDLDAGRDALWLAGALASGDRRLTLAHVQVLGSKPAPDSGAAGSAAARRSALERLTALRGQSQLDAEVVCAEARGARRGLHDLARARDADLLVIGASRQDEIYRDLVGDDARELLEDAPCAVAVAPVGYADRRGPLRRIGVAYDRSPESVRALAMARKVADDRHAKLSAFQAVAGPGHIEDTIDDEVAQALERIDKLGGVDAYVEYGEPASELRRYGRSVDLLVLGSHKHSPIGRLLGQGTAQRLADEPPCPLLVVGRD
jgi:nucleotide-binding universal stress UspA family protein